MRHHNSQSLSNIISCLVIYIILQGGLFAASHHPEDFLKSIAGSKTEGQQIVEHYCATCHAESPLISLGAPRQFNKMDWKVRLKQGLQTLFKHTDEGFNAMPPRGGCFECSDEQLMRALLALLPPPEKP